ncbi:hypothetical protein DL93DRAFT_1393629 [Clavulina sp. PMI_390]|nr:hypothetical protein DL93DRAFT_1393629 [Clavulina sp. PMI_390]
MDKMRRRGLASPSMLDLSSSPSSSPSSASPLARMNSNSNDVNGGGRSNAPGVLSALKSFRLFRAKKVSESDPPSATMSTPSFQAPPPSPRKQKISQPTDPRLLGPPRPMHIPTTRFVFISSTLIDLRQVSFPGSDPFEIGCCVLITLRNLSPQIAYGPAKH